VGVQRLVGMASDRKKWLLPGSLLQKKFKKMFNTSVQIMLAMMIMQNYSPLFSYPHDNHFKEEILPFPQHYLNLSVILYHITHNQMIITHFNHFSILQISAVF
jgi:hypothetical protein